MARVARALTITPIHPYLGARVEGVDLEETLDEPTFRPIFDVTPWSRRRTGGWPWSDCA